MNPINSGANQENIPISHSCLDLLMQAEVVICFLIGGGPFKLFRAAMCAMQLSLGANNITSSDPT